MHITKHIEEIFLWQLFGTVIIIGLLVWFLNRYIKKKGFTIVPSLAYNPIGLIKTLVLNPGLLKRLLFTIGMLIVFHLLSYVPMLGINYSALYNRYGVSEEGGKFYFFIYNNPFKIFRLGIIPFFSACLLIQFFSVIIPFLRRNMFSEGKGRRTITKYTYILTGILCVIQSWIVCHFVVNMGFENAIINVPVLAFYFITILFLTGAVFALIYMALQINRYGIGNGFGMMILSGIFLGIFYNVKNSAGQADMLSSTYSPGVLLLMGVVVAALFYCMYFVTSREHRITLSHKEHTGITLPISFSVTGIRPRTLAISFGAFIRVMFPDLRESRIFYYLILIVFLSPCIYMYMFIVLNPRYIACMAKKYGYHLQNGDAETLQQNLSRKRFGIMLFLIVFLILIILIPEILFSTKIPDPLYRILVGTSIIGAVGIIFDILKQLEYYKKRSESSIKNWALYNVVYDEIEASFICGYLLQNKIVSLVKPYRLSWRMPIRTIVDKYEIYVPAIKKDEAGSLLVEKNGSSAEHDRAKTQEENTTKESEE